MSSILPATNLQLRSLVKPSGEIELSLAEVELAAPGPKDVVVRVEGSPINPSDLGLLLGFEGAANLAADTERLTASGSADRPVVTAPISQAALSDMANRVGKSLPVGNEGAGIVVAAGDSDEAQALLGKTVAMLGGAMHAQYRTIPARACLVLPDDATPEDGASCFVNPLTALGMVGTMRLEGHTALVHTAAASNLGQMLVRICRRDGVQLVNVVRSAAQAELLRGIGAVHVCDSSSPTFLDDLTEALVDTGATLAFDAIGGGKTAGQILTCMEVAANRRAPAGASMYGSAEHKQVYIYGGLDTGPTVFERKIGLAWGIGGWLLQPFMSKIGPVEAQKLREQVAAEVKTTFASHYTRVISLHEALQPEVIAGYVKRATGEKYLVNPAKR